MTAWKNLTDEYPEEGSSILIKNGTKVFYGIRVIDDDGDLIHCQEDMQGAFVFSINLATPFNDRSYEWREFDD